MKHCDVFVVFPTGYGKTVCYNCLSLANDLYKNATGSLIIVLSPLIALMANQVIGVHDLVCQEQVAVCQCARPSSSFSLPIGVGSGQWDYKPLVVCPQM